MSCHYFKYQWLKAKISHGRTWGIPKSIDCFGFVYSDWGLVFQNNQIKSKKIIHTLFGLMFSFFILFLSIFSTHCRWYSINFQEEKITLAKRMPFRILNLLKILNSLFLWLGAPYLSVLAWRCPKGIFTKDEWLT